MKKNIAIIILLAVLAIISITFLIREGINLNKQLGYVNELSEQQEKYLKNIEKFTKNYNDLYHDYQDLNKSFNKLAADKGFYEDWETFTITAYTSRDQGCNSISAIGIDIEKMSRLYNFAAVDPEVIPYGSIILVKFDTGIEPFLSVDCGGAIRGKRIDLYFVNDLKEAFRFGKKDLEVKVIR